MILLRIYRLMTYLAIYKMRVSIKQSIIDLDFIGFEKIKRQQKQSWQGKKQNNLKYSLKEMFIHHTFKTPLKKKSQTISYETTQPAQSHQENSKFRERINELYQNFNSLNSTIDIDLNKKRFNLIEYEKEDQKIKYDPQIINAKLKKLENQAQINRIQMQLELRRKKRAKSQNKHLHATRNQFQKAPYQQTYQSFLKNSKLIEMPQNDSESEEDQTQPKPKGISRFHQLKKHSKILEYTMKKMKQKEEESIKQEKYADERKLEVKNITNDLKDYGEFHEIIRKQASSIVSLPHDVNPEVIIEDKFKRIMTMKAKDKISDKVKQNPRCNYMMNIQNDILLGLEEEKKSLSKDNMKKLKSRFIEIVNELHKGDKKRKENKFLPSIDTLSFTANNTARTKKTKNYTRNLEKMSYTFDLNRNHENSREEIRQNHLTIDSRISKSIVQQDDVMKN